MIEVDADGPNVHTVKFDDISAGWEQWILLSADHHVDNIKCNRELLRQHLELARRRQALVFVFGDLFCAMQGKYDPRSDMDELRSEDKVEKYLDSIVKHAAEFYAPFAKQFCLIGDGTHERSITKHHHTSLISNLVHRLNSDHGGNVFTGGFGGWVRFMFTIQKTRRTSKLMKYHHGAGGGGPVTKGVIQTARQAVYLPDADIVVNGHTHDAWILPIKRERLSRKGKLYKDLLWFVRTPGYKDGYGEGDKGFETEKWQPPKPLGAIWLRFYMEEKRGIELELTPAVT